MVAFRISSITMSGWRKIEKPSEGAFGSARP